MLNETDLSRTDLNLLVLFEAVLSERHVGRAAARLSLTPSAVSHGLGRLRRLLNDPLFLRTPKGVVPTARAVALQEPIAEVLARIRSVVSSAGPFDAATSTRRFKIGAPDGVSAVFLPGLLEGLRASAPGIDISIRQLLPVAGEQSPEHAWRSAFDDLESRAMDVAIVPSDHVPVRFARRTLYEDSFVLAMRSGHAFKKKPTLSRYCDARHLVVSLSGDHRGFVDEVLERQGLSRRVALTVPNFMFALGVLADSDFICALPRRFVMKYAARHGLVAVDSPVPLGRFKLNVVVPQGATTDDGLAWFVMQLLGTNSSKP